MSKRRSYPDGRGGLWPSLCRHTTMRISRKIRMIEMLFFLFLLSVVNINLLPVVQSLLHSVQPVCRACSLDRRSIVRSVPPPTSVRLWGKKAKRGRLGSIIAIEDDDDDDLKEDAKTLLRRTPQKQEPKQTNPIKKKIAVANKSSNISPDLAKFMQQKSNGNEAVNDISIDDEEDDDDDAPITTQQKQKQPKKGGSSGKQPISVQPSLRPQLNQERAALVSQIKNELQTLVDVNTKGTANSATTLVADIVSQLRQLPTREPQQQLLPPPLSDYRLLWAGSERALTHVGTGLFNVPLARLQEVFLCCCTANTNAAASLSRRSSSSTKNKNMVPVQWIEVIRILGPFPNVRNTLTGTLKASSNSNTPKWQIAWDSLIDGTGKEIYADQVRKVDLSLFYCDEQIIVLTTTTTTTKQEDNSSAIAAIATATAAEALSEAQDILVFVREGDMEDKLVRYRVA